MSADDNSTALSVVSRHVAEFAKRGVLVRDAPENKTITRRNDMNISISGKGIVAWVVMLSATFGLSGAMAQHKVTYGVGLQPAPYWASVQFGKSLGFFKEEGIDLEIVAVQGATVLYPQIASKGVTFGLVAPDLQMIAADKGARFPIKLVSHIYEKNVFEYVVLEKSPIQKFSDLKGKKLGIGALTWGNIPQTKAILADAGLVVGKDVQLVPVGIGPAAWSRLVKGEVDALGLVAHQHEMIPLTGNPIRRLPVPDKYQSLFSNGIAAHEDTIASNPKLVEAFGRAMAKSYFACSIVPDACAKSFWEFDPATRPTPEKADEWIRVNTALNRLDTQHANTTKTVRWGEFSVKAWTDYRNVLKESEQITNDKLDVEQFYTNQFIQGINNFDRETVRKKVKGL